MWNISEQMIPVLAPELVANDGPGVLRAAIETPSRYAIEPKVDRVCALMTFGPDGIEVRGRVAKVDPLTRTQAQRGGALTAVIEGSRRVS